MTNLEVRDWKLSWREIGLLPPLRVPLPGLGGTYPTSRTAIESMWKYLCRSAKRLMGGSTFGSATLSGMQKRGHTVGVRLAHAPLKPVCSHEVAILILITCPALPQRTAFLTWERSDPTLKQCSCVCEVGIVN